jgi:hypothetical protein
MFIHGMLKMCYRGMLPKPFEGKLRRQINLGKLQKHAFKSNECEALERKCDNTVIEKL